MKIDVRAYYRETGAEFSALTGQRRPSKILLHLKSKATKSCAIHEGNVKTQR